MDDLTMTILDLHAQGYCCTQVMFILALDMQGKSNPDLVRAIAGLCHGVGFSRDVCGILSGGACLLSLYTAKGTNKEERHPHHAGIQIDFVAWFHQTYGVPNKGIHCADIMSHHDRGYCKTMLVDTYRKIMDILVEHDIDPLTM